MHPTTPTVPTHARSWPAEVQAAVQRRADALAPALRGAVFDLAELDGGRHAWPDRRFDTIVSIAELPRFADLPALARAALDHIADDGILVMVEPSAQAGLWPTVRATFGDRAATRGLHLNRDAPWALRHAGWHFGRMERDRLAGTPWALRFWASGTATPRPLPPDRPLSARNEEDA